MSKHKTRPEAGDEVWVRGQVADRLRHSYAVYFPKAGDDSKPGTTIEVKGGIGNIREVENEAATG